MEIIWWEIEEQSWAWLAEESVGQGCVRKREGIQAGWHVKREEGEFFDIQSTVDRPVLTRVNMRNWKGKNEWKEWEYRTRIFTYLKEATI